MPTPPRLPRLWAPVVAGLAGLGWFLCQFHLVALDVTNIGWVMRGDWGQNELGWLMFRQAPWTFPLGSIPGLLYPVGTSIAFTDSTPLASFLLKPFGPLLPQAFQFIGPWLALCFVLQGICGAFLTGLFTDDERLKALGGTLFALAPVLVHRTFHVSLTDHWLVLVALWIALAPVGDRPWRRIGAALGLVAVSAVVHPYLWAMVVPLVVAFLVRLGLERRETPTRLLFAAALILAVSLVEFYCLGIVGRGLDRGAGGFGYYNADLLALLNPMDRSRYLPTLPAGPGQYEGYAYLGLGVLSLIPVAMGLAWKHRASFTPEAQKRWLPVVVVSVLLAIYSLGSVVTVAGHTLATMRHLYRPFGFVTGPLRSSGRFIWPLVYLIGTASLAIVLRTLRERRGTALLLLAAVVAVQFGDLRQEDVPTAPTDRWNLLKSARWDALAEGRSHLVLYPAQTNHTGYGDAHPRDLWQSAIWLAYRHRMTVNSGYVARANLDRLDEACRQLLAQTPAPVSPDSLYIVAEGWKDRFLGRADVACERIDGELACVRSGKDPRQAGLAQPPRAL